MLKKYRFPSMPIALASFFISASILLSASCTTSGDSGVDIPADTEQTAQTEQASEESAEQSVEQSSALGEEVSAEELAQKPETASFAGFVDPRTVLNEKSAETAEDLPEAEIPVPDVPEITAPVYPSFPKKTERSLTKEFPAASHVPRLPQLSAERKADSPQEAEHPKEASRQDAPAREEASREEPHRQDAPARQERESPAPPPEEEKPRDEDPVGRQEEKARVQRVEPEIPLERKSVWAAPGDTVELFLKERGWVYDQGSSSAEGVDFRERSYKEESTEFVFRVQRTGSFQLTFFRENMSTGEREQQIVDIISTLSGEMPEGLSTSPTGPAGEQGKEGEPPSREEIREAVDRGDSGYLARNIEGLTFLASGGGEPGALSLAIEAAQTLLENGRQREAKEILQRGLENTVASEDEREALYFYLGRLYESRGPLRDEHRAADYYQKVIEYFPAGIYWNDAKERKRYLERHYLQVR